MDCSVNAQSDTFPRFLFLSGFLLFCLSGFNASGASELLTTLQRENAALKKQAQDLRVELDTAQRKAGNMQEQIAVLEASRAALEKKMSDAVASAKAAEERTLQADAQAAQAVATLQELRGLIQKQAGAISAQKEEISETNVANQVLNERAEDARQARDRALEEAQAAIDAAKVARLKALREEANGHYNLGVVLARSGKSAAAEKQFLACLDLLPDDADSHYNLGILYDGPLQVRSKAIRHFKRFIELAPESSDAERVAQWLEKIN